MMRGLLVNILLALAWAALSGDFAPSTLAIGFGIGFVVLLLNQRIIGSPEYPRKVWGIIELSGYFFLELLMSNYRVARDVLRPRLNIRPGVISVPLDAQTDIEIMLLVSLVLLTPGTLALDVSSDRSELYIHAMDIDDPEKVRAQIKNGFERRVLGVLR